MLFQASKATVLALAALAGLSLPAYSLSLAHGRNIERRANHRLHLPPERRGKGNRFSWYDAGEGVGACGKRSSGNDFVVAISHLDWDNGEHCGKRISIQVGSNTVQAEIVDECMGCGKGDLDFSHSLFATFGSPEILGILHGTWHLGSSSHDEKPKHESMTTTRKHHLQTKPSSTSTAHKYNHTSSATTFSESSTPSTQSATITTSESSAQSSSQSTSSAMSTLTEATPTASVVQEEDNKDESTARIQRALRGMGRLAGNATGTSP